VVIAKLHRSLIILFMCNPSLFVFLILVGSSGGGELSVEATVDIGTDTVAVVAGTQAAVAQPVGDNAAEMEEGEVEATVAIQSKFDSSFHFSVLVASCSRFQGSVHPGEC